MIPPPSLESRAKAHFGVTTHLPVKGWVTPDGSVIEVVAHDYLDEVVPGASPDEAVDAAIEAGFIRIGWSDWSGRSDPEFIVRAFRPLSSPQRRALRTLVAQAPGEAAVFVEASGAGAGAYSVQFLAGDRLALARAIRELDAALPGDPTAGRTICE